MNMTELLQGQRVDWWRVLEDLRRSGLSMDSISQAVGIPRSTLLGYRNLDAEPKHADGSLVVALWKARHDGAVLPVVQGSVRIVKTRD
jgi:hypothetical protein